MNILKQSLLISFFIIFVTACGGGGTTVDIAPAGIYSGTVTPTGGTPDSAVAIITSNNKVTLIDTNTFEAFIGTRSGNSLTGTMYSSSAIPATAEITSVSGSNISGTYTSSLGGGTFALVADPNLFNRTSSLSKLTGTWVDSVFTTGTGTSTWVIQADGAFAVTTTLGCNATGSFSVFNTANNEYNLDITITNCASLDGTFTGFAVISDTSNTDDTISLVFNNGSVGGLSEPIKQ